MTDLERKEEIFNSISSLVYKLDRPPEEQEKEIEYYDPIIRVVVKHIDNLYKNS